MNESEPVRQMWLVKYALSSGINHVPIQDKGWEPSGFVRIVGNNYQSYKIGRDIFDDKEEAIRAAYEMKHKKIDSLEKQLKKLKDMQFWDKAEK